MSLAILKSQPADPLLALIEEVRSDHRDNKIDLSLGVYRDEMGCTKVLDVVKQAEIRLVNEQNTKSYLGPEGDCEFTRLLSDVVFGPLASRVSGLQTPGGTGALRLAGDLLAIGGAGRRVWLGLPTWPNHLPVLEAAGLTVRAFNQVDPKSQSLDLEATIAALEAAKAGDVVVLQACCHNPTGIDPDARQWAMIAKIMEERRLVPLIDMAYHGLGDGLEPDGAMVRLFVETLPEVLIAYSCNKNFALYRDRVGALFVSAPTGRDVERILSNAKALVRANYSMPPDHGAAVVSMILGDTELKSGWRRELDRMRLRISEVRKAIAHRGHAGTLDLVPIASQNGMFSLLPLGKEQIQKMKRDHAVYMAPSGRVNLAGLPLQSVSAFVDALECVSGLQDA